MGILVFRRFRAVAHPLFVLLLGFAGVFALQVAGAVRPAGAASPSFTTGATVSRSSAPPGTAVQITASVTSSAKADVLVDVEVYDASDQRVFQQWFANQAFSPKSTRSYAVTWTIPADARAGTYRVVVAVKSNDWRITHAWNAQAAAVSVTAPTIQTSAATATAAASSTPTPTRAPATATAQATATPAATSTPSPTLTRTPTVVASLTPTRTASATASASATATRAATATASASASATAPATTTAPPAPPGGFVGRSGTSFTLGGAPFSFVGANLYNAAGQPDIYQCGPWMQNPDVELDDWFRRARAEYGARVVRFWAYQSYTRGGTDWRGLDRVMRLANAHGLKVIPVLENQWTECTEGGFKYESWYAGGYLEPYGAYPLSYKEYVRRVVTRYANEPAVAAWMLMNEAESKSPAGVANPSALYGFASEMSAFVKSLDANHLVTLGVIGSGQPGVSGPDYHRLHSIASIDFAEYHDYGADDQSLPGAPLAITSGLTTSVYTQDQTWGWVDQGFRANGARTWEVWTGTVPAGGQPFQRIGLSLSGAFTGDVYIDKVQIGARVYDFEDGTAQGWQVSGPGTLANSAAVAHSGARSLRLTRTGATSGTHVWIPAQAGDAPGTPITVHLYVDTAGTASGYNTLAAALHDAQRLGKPLLVGESGMATCGIPAGAQVETPQSRAEKFNAKLGAFFGSGGAGYLVWQWHPSSSCEYSFTTGDPLNGVLLAQASARGT